MPAMPRTRPPYLHHERDRYGTLRWYVRVGRGPRTAIKAKYGTAEFMAAYHAAIRGEPKAAEPAGTLAALISAYRLSEAWAKLSAETRRVRGSIYKAASAEGGAMALQAVTPKGLRRALIKRGAKPHMAAVWLKAMRALFAWAVEAELLDADPSAGIKAPAVKTDGFHVWTEEEVAAFEAHWPLGTRERLAFDVLLWTGLRRGDAVRLGRQHVRNGNFVIVAEKNGIEIDAPIMAPLARSIAAYRARGLTFIENEAGMPYTAQSFSYWFREACREAGVPGSPHGLRKAGATRAADNGATDAQLEALFGWARGSGMAAVYTKKADRKRLAREAARIIERTSIPELFSEFGNEAGKLSNDKGLK